jgi:murein DD-endopeptidase MepM/ murein hydrolase activator NlpD
MKKLMPVAIVAVVVLAVAADIFLYILNDKNLKIIFDKPAPANTVGQAPVSKTTASAPSAKLMISEPIANALARVTKKPFGLYVSPDFSPVTPERFTGYHTGVDFETTSNEQNIDVPIYAICPGKLLLKKTASGYGGVIAESCTLAGQAVTVTYGHLRLASIVKKIGQSFVQGEQIGVLGEGYSSETDGERKHLHLGIHKGAAAVISGYVANFSELQQWINVLDYLKPRI